MKQDNHRTGLFESSHMLILVSYTLLALGLVFETLLMSWELWAIPLILSAVAVCWYLHTGQKMTEHQRVWIYTFLMMGTFFFYGIHLTSIFDMSTLMIIMILIFTVVGEGALVTFCQITYYFTLLYDVIFMIRLNTVWDSLLISRLILHFFLMTLACWLARFIIKLWAQLFEENDIQIRNLNKATRRMNQFLANLSHELRTPVNAILGTTDTLLFQHPDHEFGPELYTVRNAGRRMADQISDILDYSELETDRLVINSESYSLSSLLNDLMTVLRPGLPEELELVVDVDADIPAGLVTDTAKLQKILFHLISNGIKYTREGGVYVHFSAIKQTYGINLCIEVKDTGIGMTPEEVDLVSTRFYQGDTGKSMRIGGLGLGFSIVSGFTHALGGFLMVESEPGSGTTVHVSIPQQVTDEEFCMSVASPESIVLGGYLNIRKYSNPYVREFYNDMILNIVKGLGTPMHRVDNEHDLLALLKKVKITHLFIGEEEYLSSSALLDSLSGQMNVILVGRENFPLPPSSHILIMPKPFYCFPVAAILNSDLDFIPGSERKMVCHNVHALIVDDEPMNLNVASGILRKYGIFISTADSGKEAVRMCRDQTFDLIFMDHMMPEMDGVETMKRIRQETECGRKNIPIIALTANALSTAKEMMLAEGFDGFISKPIEIPELERTLKRVLPPSSISFGEPAETISFGEPAEAISTDPCQPEEKPLPVPPDSINPPVQAELDLQMGLGHCQGDKELYDTLLEQYVSEAASKQKRLDQCLSSMDLHNYAIYVHALKSSSRLIGAVPLSEITQALETAAKKGDSSYIMKHHGEMIRDYRKLVEQIRIQINDEVLEFVPEIDELLEFFPKGGVE